MEKEFVLKAVIPDTQSGSSTVYIYNNDTKILLPISMASENAANVLLAKSYKTSFRPTFFNTIKRSFLSLNISITKVLIYKVLDDVFYAYLCLKNAEGVEVEIDSKVSDALALSYECCVPIYVTSNVYQEAGILITKDLLESSLAS
jgi:hypothetical protein